MTDDLPQQWRSKASRQLADQGQREGGGAREWRSTGGVGGAGVSRSRGVGRGAEHASQSGDQNAEHGQSDARHDEGLPQGLEGEQGALMREKKQLKPRVSCTS